ncbi:hypothetical protein Ahy_A01g002348 [Arachis hypogaea]|uniref:No apical meristem-associated C-terminal domain-containing protein n=1 Tax=Arachis hypogaea TaxID=3818 RepID=A0A445EQW1_ARAHY|nr:hypothetical protein Ahy_A01g002348 [Arachis hypogaea]
MENHVQHSKLEFQTFQTWTTSSKESIISAVIKGNKPQDLTENAINENASRHNSSGVGGFSNPSSQIPIESSPNSQYSKIANPRGLDAIDLNDDDIEDRRQDKFCSDMTKGVVAYKKRWYKINKAVTKFAGCYDQASRNIRSGSNAGDIKELAYKLYSTNYETTLADKPGVDSPVRPQGSKKSKRKGKEKTQMSENFSEKKSSVVKKLSLMEDIKNVREKELMDREKEREEERKHRAKIMAIKEKKLQIQAAMKE